jgi:CRP/FNR family cyclic AMP-dependent transcriptional regulator
MGCEPQILQQVPLFALLDDDETSVLAAQVALRSFAPRQRIYRLGEPAGSAYVMVSGSVTVTTVDDDQQDVIVDEPGAGDFFGFASMMDRMPHQTNATAVTDTVCIEIQQDDIAALVAKRPHAAIDMLTVLGRQMHATQHLVRVRAARNANEIIEQEATFGDRLADSVAGFGGSWTFIITFMSALIVYSGINVVLRASAWDPYPFILLNLFLSMIAALQAPIIMMSQNRTDAKDRVRSELDFDVNRRAASEVQALSRKLNSLADKIDDIAELVRARTIP